jgi:NADH dehydrogenase [ubiquinone] 1 alpha subcomplex assembly factor 7
MSQTETKLAARIKAYIRETGPIPVSEYMSLCLLDPVDGFYPTRDPLGSEGDFITAPEISQMFGEVLGLWVIQSWIDIGRPARFTLTELGPGRGIMMADMLRTIKLDPDCLKAVRVYLIDVSAALEAVQGQSLAQAAAPISWVKSLDDLPDDPTLIIGNEFLDCLPIRQAVQMDPFAKEKGWQERLVGLDDAGDFRFQLDSAPLSPTLQALLPSGHEDARKEELIELCPPSQQIMEQIKPLFTAHPGRALFIDYGPDITEFGDSLQALKRHQKIGVFDRPGESDLTARVNFSACAAAAAALDLAASDIVTQSELLSKLGIEMRAVTLSRHKPEAKPKILRQLHRLMDNAEMGQLFKALCISSIGLSPPLGFRA